jgi:hypothetical protein
LFRRGNPLVAVNFVPPASRSVDVSRVVEGYFVLNEEV